MVVHLLTLDAAVEPKELELKLLLADSESAVQVGFL
jgi:hypothetical protein